MARFTVGQIQINTKFDRETNLWFASVTERGSCVFRNRRLREGVYPFYNGVVADVDYLGLDPQREFLDGARIEFHEPCQLVTTGVDACGA